MIAAEAKLPVTMAEHGHGASRQAVITLVDRASDKGRYSQGRVVIAGHGLSLGDIGLPINIHVQADRSESEDIGKRTLLLAHANESLIRKGGPNRQPRLVIPVRAAWITAGTECFARHGRE